MGLHYDEVGEWSEIKLDIVKRYATEYSKIMASQGRFKHYYIDAFAGPGVHIARGRGEMIKGSPLNALDVEHAFAGYHFIDADGDRIEQLRGLVGQRPDVQIYTGDCNKILPEEIFPKVKYDDYKRALCLLDPYGIHLNWSVVETAGKMQSVEIFHNFIIMDINMNVLRKDPLDVDPKQAARLTRS
jgi:three-Cys-motif partner protein